MYKKVLDIIYPVKCPFCGKIVSAGLEKRTAHNGICSKCREKIIYIGEPRCKKCGKPIRSEESEYCYDCTGKKHIFEEGRNLWVHKEPVNQAIYAFRYQNLRIYGKTFGAELEEHYGNYLRRKEVDLIVPIPLHRKRRRRRGYNQAQILAKELSVHANIPMDASLMKRIRETRPQKKLDDKESRKNIRGAFAATHPVEGRRIVLVDDIYTTGSTLDEAAKVIYRAGAEKVYFLTISIGQGF